MSAVTATDRLRTIGHAPGPFVSAYLARGTAGQTATHRFDEGRATLAAAGASNASLDAIASRLSLPTSDDAAGLAVIAAADGTAVAASAPEPPREDLMVVDSLPRSAPLLEWDQWRVPHLVVTATPDVIEVARFVPEEPPSIRPIGTEIDDAAVLCGRIAREDRIPLVVVGGDEATVEKIETALLGTMPVRCRVVTLDDADVTDTDTFAAAVVREVADHVARTTVNTLKEFRFQRGHDAVAEGAESVIEWLNRGRGDDLLIHDDPTDNRTAWFGATSEPLSLEPDAEHPHAGRLVDIAIHTALAQRMSVRVIPTTGDGGPEENIALMLRDPAVNGDDLD